MPSKLFWISPKTVWTVSTSPAVRSPFLFSQFRHCFSMLRRHLPTKSPLVALGSRRELFQFFAASDACSIQHGQIWARFSNKIRAWFALFRCADLRARFRTHCTTSTRAIWRIIGQRPPQSLASKNPTLLSVCQLFMCCAVFKDKDPVHQPKSQEFSYPLNLRIIFSLRMLLIQACNDRVPSRTPETVAGFSNIAEFSVAGVDKRVDNELVTIGHLRLNVSQTALTNGTARRPFSTSTDSSRSHFFARNYRALHKCDIIGAR